MKIITDERCAGYHSPGHPERPTRVTRTREYLEKDCTLALEWARPGSCDDTQLLRAHSQRHLDRLNEAVDFDGDTPHYEGIAQHARHSVGAALKALEAARSGHTAFSLMRPPGHHATSDQAMGFCYLNNVAIAVLEALATGSQRAAVFDFDVHHGNGTEAILLNRAGVRFYSVHQSPCYPGTGLSDVGQNCFNFTVAPGVSRDEYRAVLERAIEQMLASQPDLVAVSAGFDGYARDPLANGALEAEDYHWLGESLARVDAPLFHLLEGGYSKDLPELIHAYLIGADRH